MEPAWPLLLEHGAGLESRTGRTEGAVGPGPRVADGAGDILLSKLFWRSTGKAEALALLHDSFRVRGMADAQRSVAAWLRRLKGQQARAEEDGAGELLPSWKNDAELAQAIDSLIEDGRSESAVRLFEEGA